MRRHRENPDALDVRRRERAANREISALEHRLTELDEQQRGPLRRSRTRTAGSTSARPPAGGRPHRG
jgi:hypothetical protein